MAKYSVCVVDDSQDDVDDCIKYLKNINEIKDIHSITNPFDLPNLIERENIDIIFMDIEMLGAAGFEIYASIPVAKRPVFVMVSYHEKFALEGFRATATDYIIKSDNLASISNAFTRSLTKLNISVTINNLPEREYIFCREKGGGIEILFFAEIIYIEGNGNYSNVYMRGGVKREVCMGIGALVRVVPISYFIRIHHSYIANVRFVKNVTKQRLFVREGGVNGLPVS